MQTIKKIGLVITLLPMMSVVPVQANFFDDASAKTGEFFEDVFFGGTIGQSDAKRYCNGSSSCNDTDTSWKVYGGYKINEVIDAEVSYSSIGDINRVSNATIETSEVSALSLSAVGKYNINDSVEALGKLGLTRWSSSNSDGDEDGVALSYGFGAKVSLNENMKLRAEWESIPDVETTGNRDTDVTIMSIGIELETL